MQMSARFEVNYVPLPPEREAAWRANLLLLIDFLLDDHAMLPNEVDGSEYIQDFGIGGD